MSTIVKLILKVFRVRYLVRITGQSACKPGSKFTHCTGNEHIGVLCLLEIKLTKLTHYTVIAIQVFVIAHVFVQCTASVALSL